MSIALANLRTGSLNLKFASPRPALTAWTAWTQLRPALLWAPLQLWTPNWNSLLELIPAVLKAVPKKKVSHSRKAMRSANKGLKDKMNLVSCPGCGTAKLAHHLCANCYSQISRNYKRELKERREEGHS